MTYTITSTNNLTATVPYMNTDPPSQAAYNADSSQFMTTVQTPFSGGQPVVYTATLANPNQWAIVNASGCCTGRIAALAPPRFTARSPWTARWWCTQDATTAVTCSTRPW